LFASEVGGVYAFDGEEGEQGVGLVGEVFEQPSVGVTARRPGAQLIEAGSARFCDGDPAGGGGELPGGEGVFDDRLGRCGDLRVCGGQVCLDLVAASERLSRNFMQRAALL